MITPRFAQHTDVAQLVQLMLELKQHSGWRDVTHAGWTVDALTGFIRHKLLDPRSVVYVCDGSDNVVTGFCGVTLGQLPWPPTSTTVYEWGWYGPARQAAACWKAARAWGRQQGAEYAYRATAQRSVTQCRVKELATWEVL